jgi:plastocyanin
MRRAAVLAALAALALPAAARADKATITMPGKYFDPPRSTIVAGDTVVFRNNDLVTHDVRLGGGVFDSGPIARFTSWSQQIDQPGGYPFICTLHAFMSGNLDVVAATLAAAPDRVLAGEPLTLSGRAPAGTARVGVERSVAGGEWSADGAGAAPAPDGTFAATVKAVEGASYRVTTPAGASPAVTPRVTARVDVHVEVERMGRHLHLHVQTKPAATGFVATLERYSPWRFRWRPAQRVKLDSRGRASFMLPARSRSFARVALSRSRRGPALVRSGVVKLRTGRAAVDPDAIAPHAGGDGGGHGGGYEGGGGHGGGHG